MAQYLKSLVTGVVLPYVEASLKSPDVRVLDPSECAEYEASMGITSSSVVEAPVVEAPVVEAPVVEAPVVEAPVVEASVAVAITDFSEGEPDIEGVLSALGD